MLDESTLKASFFAGLFVVIPLFVSWYFKVDPLVGPLSPSQSRSFWRTNMFPAQCHPDHRILRPNSLLLYRTQNDFWSRPHDQRGLWESKLPPRQSYTFFIVRSWRCSFSQTRPGIFKIATLKTWMILVSGPEFIEDIRKAPDNVLSVDEPRADVRVVTKGRTHVHEEYHSSFKWTTHWICWTRTTCTMWTSYVQD